MSTSMLALIGCRNPDFGLAIVTASRCCKLTWFCTAISCAWTNSSWAVSLQNSILLISLQGKAEKISSHIDIASLPPYNERPCKAL